ncbi:MAG: ABC transporter ATP-binding protein [Phycisphaerales bacterium]|nr:ABC transporter ATP-binding protein [Phycisphaerales bacterium]
MSIISARQLTRGYGRRRGISAIDLDVPEGAIFGFLGPNGAGKTTAIRVLLGFLRPRAGQATIFGRDCWRESHHIKRDAGYLPGDLRLYPWMTGRSALRIVGGVRGTDLTAPGRDLADRFRLDLDVRVRRMSRGMRQKLGLILTLAHGPRLLVLDEPTSGLDPLMQITLADELRDRAARGTTIFFSSHTLSEVNDLCDRVAIIRDGTIVADEPLATLRRRARRTVRITFANGAAPDDLRPPGFLTVRRRDGCVWTCVMDGVAAPLLAWLAAHPVHDLAIGPPDLETLFRTYYDFDDRASPVDPPDGDAPVGVPS